jgi:hypothetical protein
LKDWVRTGARRRTADGCVARQNVFGRPLLLRRENLILKKRVEVTPDQFELNKHANGSPSLEISQT